MCWVSLKVQHTVHHMLQDLGPGDGALLVHVSDDKDRDIPALGQLHEGHGAALYLPDAAGRAVHFLVVEGLDGVHNKDSGPSSSTDWRMSSNPVSDRTRRFSLSTPSRRARSFSCPTDSSPETYSTLANCPRLWRFGASEWICRCPAAPPTSTREPFTAPPPSTGPALPCRWRTGFPALPQRHSSGSPFTAWRDARLPSWPRPGRAFGAASCSTMVFHSPQAGQRPAHFGVSLPQAVQKKTLFGFAMCDPPKRRTAALLLACFLQYTTFYLD